MIVFAPDDVRLIEVTGTDRVSYLDDVTTQRFADAVPGEVRGAMVLDAHGAPLAVFWVVVHAERLALLAPPASAEHVLEVLATRTFLADVTFSPTGVAVWGLYGDGIGEVLGSVGVHGLEPGRWRPVDDGLVVRHAFGAEIVGEDLAARIADGLPAAHGDLEGARIRAGEPRPGREVASPHLPEELGLLPTHVHLSKGCYPGQEAVARMWMLGRPRRQLARVRVEGQVSEGWTTGSGRQRVEVTGVADGHGLAFVPSGTQPGARFDSDGDGSVEVVGLVGADRAPVGWDPATRRRRDR